MRQNRSESVFMLLGIAAVLVKLFYMDLGQIQNRQTRPPYRPSIHGVDTVSIRYTKRKKRENEKRKELKETKIRKYIFIFYYIILFIFYLF